MSANKQAKKMKMSRGGTSLDLDDFASDEQPPVPAEEPAAEAQIDPPRSPRTGLAASAGDQEISSGEESSELGAENGSDDGLPCQTEILATWASAIQDVNLVVQGWMSAIPDQKFTRELLVDLDEFTMQAAILESKLLTLAEDCKGNIKPIEAEFVEAMERYDSFKGVVEAVLDVPGKRALKRTASD
jgi:hypothetical protein